MEYIFPLDISRTETISLKAMVIFTISLMQLNGICFKNEINYYTKITLESQFLTFKNGTPKHYIRK